MPEERVISLRPHHVQRFIEYVHGFTNVFDNPDAQSYGKEFIQKLRDLFDYIATGGTDNDWVLVINRPDSVCNMCPRKTEYCENPDTFSGWDVGFLEEMERMDLRDGFIYSLGEFTEKVKKLYPDRNP